MKETVIINAETRTRALRTSEVQYCRSHRIEPIPMMTRTLSAIRTVAESTFCRKSISRSEISVRNPMRRISLDCSFRLIIFCCWMILTFASLVHHVCGERGRPVGAFPTFEFNRDRADQHLHFGTNRDCCRVVADPTFEHSR